MASPIISTTNSPRVKSEASSPRAESQASPRAESQASPRAESQASSPRVKSEPSSPKNTSAPTEEMDMSLFSWITNTHSVLHSPLSILVVAGLLVLGTFVEIAPRNSLEFLNNTLGRSLFFIIPFLIAIFLDWPTGVLAATVSLIIFARLQKQDNSEGFSDSGDGSDKSTDLISNSNRWFIERVLDERPIAISSDRVTTSPVNGSNSRNSSSMSSIPADSSSSSNK